MNRRRLLRRIRSGRVHNVRFADFTDLMMAFGFEEQRTRGSHRVFVHGRAEEILNVQAARGQAKPYQLRAFLRLVDLYDLTMEAE